MAFPRISGKCLIHHIPSFIAYLEDALTLTVQSEDLSTADEIIMYNNYMREKGLVLGLKYIDDNDLLTNDELIMYNNDIREKGLVSGMKYLNDHDVDLVKGDIIIFGDKPHYRNVGKCIFDGSKLIDLDFDINGYDYVGLPKIFRIIEDKVPIKYWENNDEHVGIDHNCIVWFNHNLVKNQCLKNVKYGLKNVKYGLINDVYAVFTTFTYDDIEYMIIYNDMDGYCEDDIDYRDFSFINANTASKVILAFTGVLSSDEEIMFQYCDGDYEIEGNVLYIQGRWH